MGGNGLLARASEKLLPMYSGGMLSMMAPMSSTTWPSPSMMRRGLVEVTSFPP